MYWQFGSYIAEREHWLERAGPTLTETLYLCLSQLWLTKIFPAGPALRLPRLARTGVVTFLYLEIFQQTRSSLPGTARALPTTNSLHLGWSPVSSTVLPSAVTSGPANNHIRECVVVLSVCQTDGSHHQHCHHWWGKYPGLLNEVMLHSSYKHKNQLKTFITSYQIARL